AGRGAFALAAAELAVVAAVERAARLQAGLGDAGVRVADVAGVAIGAGAAAGLAGVRREVAVAVAVRRRAVEALDVAHAGGGRKAAALHRMIDAFVPADEAAAARGRAGAGRAALAHPVVRV